MGVAEDYGLYLLTYFKLIKSQKFKGHIFKSYFDGFLHLQNSITSFLIARTSSDPYNQLGSFLFSIQTNFEKFS